MTKVSLLFILIGGVALGAFALYGCQQSRSGKAAHELCVEAQDDVTLHGVVVRFGEQTIPFGVTNHFGASWFPVRYELGTDFVMEVSWWVKSVDDKYSSTVTITGPTDAELSRFDGVQLTYSDADGWLGKLRLKDPLD